MGSRVKNGLVGRKEVFFQGGYLSVFMRGMEEDEGGGQVEEVGV